MCNKVGLWNQKFTVLRFPLEILIPPGIKRRQRVLTFLCQNFETQGSLRIDPKSTTACSALEA